MHYRQAEIMDTHMRLVLEKTVECILDAGYHPSELEGTNTGVFFGSSFSESESQMVPKCDFREQQFALTGLALVFRRTPVFY